MAGEELVEEFEFREKKPCQLLPSLPGSLQSAAVLEVVGSKSLFLTDIIYCSFVGNKYPIMLKLMVYG